MQVQVDVRTSIECGREEHKLTSLAHASKGRVAG